MMEGLKVLDMESCIVVADNKAKGEKRAKGSKMGSSPRKKLADISNLQQLPKPSNQEEKPQKAFSIVTSDYIDKLHKELKSGKDKLKALHHELGCKNGLLKARKLVSENKAKRVTYVNSENRVGAAKCEEAGKFITAEEVDNKPSNTSRRGRPSKTLGASTVLPVQTKENIDNKRPCLRWQSARFNSEEAEPTEDRLCSRRQSARFKSEEAQPTEDRPSASFQSEEPEQTEKRVRTRRQSARFKSDGPEKDLFEIDEAKFPSSPPPCDELIHESCPTSSNLSVEREHEGNGDVEYETQGTRRYSGRMSRQAAAKVQSYKEIPINLEGCPVKQLRRCNPTRKFQLM